MMPCILRDLCNPKQFDDSFRMSLLKLPAHQSTVFNSSGIYYILTHRFGIFHPCVIVIGPQSTVDDIK
jgi:hypothetical protein